MKSQKGEKCETIKVGRDSGRVKVFVRVRPPRPNENSRKEQIAVNVEELSSKIHVTDPKHSWEKTFNFDHVFPKEATNPEVCSTISRPLVNAALNGFNGTLMAYGQTGSGKTHTLMAPDGITAGVIERCFKRITKDDYHDYKVTMSYLQIYQEKIYDLLNSTNKVELSLREHPVKGVYVENLTEFVVRSPSEVLHLLAVGKKRLIFAETKMNRNSSRSHSVCQLTIERTLNKSKMNALEGIAKHGANGRDSRDGLVPSKSSSDHEDSGEDLDAGASEENDNAEDESFAKMVAFDDDVLIRGRIYLCDLAGSERLKKTQAEGERLSEAQHINLSLLELGNVIQALAEGKKTHVPFRNSTLTRLLQESLGGNCKTSLVVCVSPTMGDVSETKSALFFGSRAMKITNTAYVNVEVDYKRLSEDLSKIVDRREKDLEDLKQTFETRIERLKHEAERTVTNAMAEADRVVASVKSLHENEKSSLESDIENLNFRLDEEKTHTENLQDQITKAKGKLQEDMFKARSTLLTDIISMQLLYALKDLPLDNDHHLSENDLSLKDFCSQWATTKCKILENADVLLDLLKSYLSSMNSEGHKLLEDGGSLKSLVGCEESFNADKRLVSASEEVSLYMTNKTDDDKVVASTGCCEILPCSETNTENFILSTEQTLGDGEEGSNIRNKLVSLKKFIDDKAVAFLTKAFELDVGNENRLINTRQDIYGRIQEFLKQEDTLPDFRENAAELSHVADALSLLDHCHSHVIVDKALQGALLVLENNIVIKRCNIIQKQKDVLQDENETLRKQIQILQKEAEKLNGKLNETSSSLCDVMKSKEQLEDDLSSVFQLHNMRNTERKVQKENGGKLDVGTILQENVITLLENNTKLQEKLEVSENDKENLKSELTSVKEELQRLNEGCMQEEKGTQTDLVDQNEFMKPLLGDQSKPISDRNGIIHAILSSLHDDQSSLLEKAAFAAQSNNVDDVSSLRAVINRRLGEEWSLVVLENARMKSELDDILGRISEEKRNLVSELTDWKFQAPEVNSTKEELNTKGEDFADGFKVPMDENENGSSDKLISKIDIYDQNEVIAELRMDEQEDKGEPRREGSTTGDYWESIVTEKLDELSVVHRENERLMNELDSLESKYSDPEKDQDNSNKIREKELKELFHREKQLTTNIMQLDEKCSSLDKQLGRSALENTKLKEQLRKLKINVSDVQLDKAEITAQKTALEESLRELQLNAKREMAAEMERKVTLERQLQAKPQEFEEEKALLKLKDSRVSNVEAELLETKAYYEKLLQEKLDEYEVGKQNMMKEVNSLRCLQGLPTLKKDNVQSKQEVKDGLKNGENQAKNKKNNKLNSELTRAKEQLVRLKAELTLSTMQTRNLGSQLSSLREDSSKLEAELSTVRVSPRNSRQRRASFSFYEETVRLEMELAEAKETIIDLQEKLLIIYKEKFALEEKIVSLEGQRNAHLENGEKPYSANNDHEPFCDLEKTKVLKSKIGLLEAEKEQLKRELDNTNADKTRLESIEHCVQQLVSLEDEHLRMKDRLKKWAQNSKDEQQLNETRKTVSKFPENSYFNELRALSGENLVLQEEVSGLRETIAQLESDLAALKLKLSLTDAAQDASLDKKTVATLLVSVKQERVELQKALNDALIEKDDLDEELSEIKVKYAKLQREFAMTSIVKDDLELEVLSLKKASLTRGLSNLTQSSEDCKSEMSDSSLDDKLINHSDGNGVGDSMDKKTASLGGGRKRAPAVNSRKTVITKNLKAERDSFSSGRSTSSSSPKNEKKTPPQRPNNLQSVPISPKKSVGKRAKPSEPGGEKLSSRTPRSVTDDNQSTNDNPQHLAICYDLIRIDDAVSEACALHANTDCMNSGLLRKTPEGQRLNPEGMEHENETCFDTDNTEDVDKKDSSDIFWDDTIETDAHQGESKGISETDSTLSQSTEVLVKTAWSLKNFFRWQKSPPIPDHKIDALTQ